MTKQTTVDAKALGAKADAADVLRRLISRLEYFNDAPDDAHVWIGGWTIKDAYMGSVSVRAGDIRAALSEQPAPDHAGLVEELRTGVLVSGETANGVELYDIDAAETTMAKAAEAIAALSRVQGPVAVKPLEWHASPTRENSWLAPHGFGENYVAYRYEGQWRCIGQDWPSLEAAKAAAQADYERHLGYDCMTGGIRVGPVVLDGADYGQKLCAPIEPEALERMMADARLIAAAPTMQAALLGLVEAVESELDMSNRSAFWTRVQAARTALAQARKG